MKKYLYCVSILYFDGYKLKLNYASNYNKEYQRKELIYDLIKNYRLDAKQIKRITFNNAMKGA